MTAPIRALTLAALLACAACSTLEVPAPVPVAASHSVDEADRALALAARERAAVEAEFAASEQICYGRFFVNACLTRANDKRRAVLLRIRAIEVEAGRFKRQAAVDARDAAAAEADTLRSQEQAAAAQRRALEPARPPAAPLRTAPAGAGAQRQAEHDAKMQRLQAQEAADAPKRAANAAAYEKKQSDSARRQAEVSARQREREQKAEQQAEQQAQEKARAAKQP